jgi:hypothetical protein
MYRLLCVYVVAESSQLFTAILHGIHFVVPSGTKIFAFFAYLLLSLSFCAWDVKTKDIMVCQIHVDLHACSTNCSYRAIDSFFLPSLFRLVVSRYSRLGDRECPRSLLRCQVEGRSSLEQLLD